MIGHHQLTRSSNGSTSYYDTVTALCLPANLGLDKACPWRAVPGKKVGRVVWGDAGAERRHGVLEVTETLAHRVGVKRACESLTIPRCQVYRARQPRVEKPAPARPPSARALSAAEQTVVRETLNSERFVDQAPREVYATLLDEHRYLCSVASMYRILRQNREVRERRNQLRHPPYAKPELLATGPKQVWSWDITKLRGPVKWTYFFLYVVLDIFSRYIVGSRSGSPSASRRTWPRP
jgi:transposase InsO family protein